MPSSPATPPQKTPVRRLLALTLLVLVAHGLLLGGVPATLSLLEPASGTEAQPLAIARFVTRTLEPAPVAAPREPVTTPTAPHQAPTPHAPVHAGAAATTPAAAEPAGPPATPRPATPGDTMTDTAAAANQVALAAAAASASNPAANPQALPAAAPASAVPPASTAQLARAPLFPPPIRLLYDGLGEEKGFIKYAASGEMLWLPSGAQYSARLEISAWGFRVRTWTSKGELNDTGLAPIRFGDKPRGAELATHFQRDKAIISFSANNPDVPLQQGAQDKLSALLQLSTLVAGAPQRYGAGSNIRFQAADAHRAEVWDFKVGGLEALDLPGGPMQALKLSKAPTAEFDQSIEVWLAPELHYLPVRLRITEANGAFADLLWRKTENSQ